MTVFKDIEFNHIQVWGGGRGSEGCAQKGFFSFSPVASIEVGIGPQNFLTLSFNPFDTLVYNCKVIPSASPKLLNLNQE